LRSDLGMVKLFALPDPRLSHIIVKGDLIISDANRNSEYSSLRGFWQTAKWTAAIITRSRAKTSGSHQLAESCSWREAAASACC
jgi:hypothetical protein